MPATSIPLATSRLGRERFDYFEVYAGDTAYAFTKPDFDGPAVPVPVRGAGAEAHAFAKRFHEACVAGDAETIAQLRLEFHGGTL